MKRLSSNNFKSLSRLSPFILFDARIKRYIEYYGDDIFAVKKKYFEALKVIIPAIALIAVLGFLKLKLLLISIPSLALIAYFYPVLYVWAKAEEHKKIVNNEAPFIALVSYINSLVDKGLNHTLKELSEIQELKVPRVELDFLTKMTTYMNMPFAKALERRAIIHNNDLLGKLYNSYLSALELGITIKDRLKDAVKDLLNELKDSYKAYVDKSAEMAELEFAVFLLLPIVLIGFSFTFKVSLLELLLPLLFAPAIIFLISSLQPSIDYNIKYKHVYMLAAIPVIFLIPRISLEYKVLASIFVLLVFSYFIYNQLTLANELESTLPTLLKEVSEYLKIGYSVKNAITKVRLNKRVNDVIEKYVKTGNVNSPSKLFNVTLKLLLVISRTGSSSAALEELANAIHEIVYNKSNLIKQLRLFDAMVALTPIMLWLTFTMLGKISTASVPSVAVISSYSVISALIFSKISRFTLLYFPLMLLVIAILVILSVLPPALL